MARESATICCCDKRQLQINLHFNKWDCEYRGSAVSLSRQHTLMTRTKRRKTNPTPKEVEESQPDDIEESLSDEDSDELGYGEGSDSEDPSSDDDDGEAFDLIDVDFGFFNPTENDFHGIKTLMQNYLDGEQWTCSDLVDAVIASPAGSVIKCGEDEDVIGVTCALTLQEYEKLKSIEELKGFCTEQCPKDMLDGMNEAWTSDLTALLISERLLNCPPQLAPPLMESLIQELTDSGREVQQYIFIARAYADPLMSSGQKPKNKKDKGKKKRGTADGSEKTVAQCRRKVSDLTFTTPEGEFFCSEGSHVFTFPVANRTVAPGELVPYRVFAVVPASKISGALLEMRRVIENV